MESNHLRNEFELTFVEYVYVDTDRRRGRRRYHKIEIKVISSGQVIDGNRTILYSIAVKKTTDYEVRHSMSGRYFHVGTAFFHEPRCDVSTSSQPFVTDLPRPFVTDLPPEFLEWLTLYPATKTALLDLLRRVRRTVSTVRMDQITS
jgi:hypothetical protein